LAESAVYEHSVHEYRLAVPPFLGTY
jgi:hypothetical protein